MFGGVILLLVVVFSLVSMCVRCCVSDFVVICLCSIFIYSGKVSGEVCVGCCRFSGSLARWFSVWDSVFMLSLVDSSFFLVWCSSWLVGLCWWKMLKYSEVEVCSWCWLCIFFGWFWKINFEMCVICWKCCCVSLLVLMLVSIFLCSVVWFIVVSRVGSCEV